MSMKHTPGTWEAFDLPEHSITTVLFGDDDSAEDVPTSNDGFDLAHVHGPDRVANARLIAAAPDLLAALQTAEMAMLGYTIRNEVISKALGDARAAIAKATGSGMSATVDQLFDAAFNVPRDPRSEEYKAGVRAALAFRIDGVAIPQPYAPGTASDDAFYAGTQEGHAIWRRTTKGGAA